MLDRYKFRAWNKEEKRMYYDAQDTYDYMTGQPIIPAERFAILLEDEKEAINVKNQNSTGQSEMQSQTKKALELESENRRLTADSIDRTVLVAAVLKKLEDYYERFLAEEDLGFLLEAYNKKLINLERQVKVLGSDGQEECKGTAKGINREGELLVETEEGLIAVRSGEVSVRGLYGYV